MVFLGFANRTHSLLRTKIANKSISVLLVDDHTMFREGLRNLLKMEGDIELIGEAQNGRQAVALVEKLRPAVVVMDIGMPWLNGLEATRQILKEVPSAKIIILTAHSDDAYVKNARESGAVGFLPKQASTYHLCEVIREVNKGHMVFGQTIANRSPGGERKSLDQSGWTKPRKDRLTRREMELIQLIAEGQANKQIAVELGIGLKTVEKHRERLMAKLNIHEAAGLTRYAIRTGIIESSVQLTII
jgi:DNA-binding NarL/FixJ family response regulator